MPSLCEQHRTAGPNRSPRRAQSCRIARRLHGPVPRSRSRMGRQHRNRPGEFRHRYRRRNYLSDHKPAPFIISSIVQGVDMVTVVTEGIFSYCGVKVKIDTTAIWDRDEFGSRQGEPVGHVTTSEYGSRMLSLGGVRHLTGGRRKEGAVTCETLLHLCERKPVELPIDDGATVIVQAGNPPVVGSIPRRGRARRRCGFTTLALFGKQSFGKVDEVVVVDDHITGVLSEHQAGESSSGVRERISVEGPPLHSQPPLRRRRARRRLASPTSRY